MFQVVLDNALMCHICKFTSATSRLTAILKGSSHNESIDDDVDICCSFFAFRKLRCTKAGHVSVVGSTLTNISVRAHCRVPS